MTSVVVVTANEEHDVVMVLQDRHPQDGWVDSWSRVVKAGQSQTEYVWSDRRIVIQENSCPSTT